MIEARHALRQQLLGEFARVGGGDAEIVARRSVAGSSAMSVASMRM